VTEDSFTCDTLGDYTCSTMSGGECVSTRRLCVTCEERDSGVFIRVQSDSMPNHCYFADKEPTAYYIDFVAPFNIETSGTKTSITSLSTLNTK